MTPKEKAQELDSRFYELVADTPDPEWRAKEGALIVASEMLNNAGFIWGGSREEIGLSARDKFREYWNEVKEEIKNL
jgi:hypothetical protein